jgi:lipopolysaccharide/colanic/teichoic acid biosynthesis glycosyltransferase
VSLMMRRLDTMHPSVRSIIKRLLDLSIAALGLILLAPVFAVVALAVYASMGGPVLFRQFRSGYRGRPFAIYKFRTMREARRANGESLPDAERLTNLGRFLRRRSLDELPQLWNVLRGDLSLVGPRPQLIEYLPLYTPEQNRRHEVRPGITGWAQVNGRNAIGWDEKFRYDVWYVDHWSHRLDLKILLSTLIQVVRCAGISERGVETVTPFRGSVVEEG